MGMLRIIFRGGKELSSFWPIKEILAIVIKTNLWWNNKYYGVMWIGEDEKITILIFPDEYICANAIIQEVSH